MSAAQFALRTGEETAINDELAARLKVNLPLSALLEDEVADGLFATFFGSTWTHSETGHGKPDFWAHKLTTWGTPALNDRPIRRVSILRSPEEAASVEPSVGIINDRITLLARKYVAKEQFRDEEKARLAIVTERVRQLMPAIKTSEFESLIEVLKLVKQVAESDKEMRNRLGIDPRKNG